MIEVRPDDTPAGQDDGHAFLLLRKHRYTGTEFLRQQPPNLDRSVAES
jgi:hypothetical protein